MIIVNLKGGLGNQMFQYAIGRSLSIRHNQELKLDLSFLNKGIQKNVTLRTYELHIFDIKENFASDQEIKRFKNIGTKLIQKLVANQVFNPYVKERYFQFDPNILDPKANCYLDGHWMSEKYFHTIESALRKDFSFRNDVTGDARELKSKILNSNSVCLHIRRGDYFSNSEVNKMHGLTPLDYFKKSIAFIKGEVDRPVFFIFSDDIDWCIDNFNDLTNVHFVEKELANVPTSNNDHFQLMTLCKHFVISNSTFSWWGAWLSSFKGKIVISPENWFANKNIVTKDIYPPSWIKM